MNNEEIQSKIMKLKGWSELPFPAIPKWQRPSVNGVECLYSPPNWPESTEDAWGLFDEMRSNFFRTAIYTWDHTDNVLVECEYRQGHNDNIAPLTAEGNSVSIAICLAYIAWKESNDHP